MGLDMYLTANKWVSEYDKSGLQISNKIAKALGVLPKYTTQNVTLRVMYWRKHNHIHNWFVNNVQRGNDDCAEYFVRSEELMELVQICRQVVADPTLAAELLPCKAGFFFGPTGFDEEYYQSLVKTADVLEAAVHDFQEGSGFSFYYQSSW